VICCKTSPIVLNSLLFSFATISVAAVLGAGACSDNGTPNKTDAQSDAGAVDDGPRTDVTTDAPAEAKPLNFAWSWAGIVGTGQSLSVGGLGTPILGTQPSANNLKLALGGAAVVPPFDSTLSQLNMVPLAEPIRPTDPAYPSAYPGNIDGETPHTAMANQITALVQQAAQRDYVTVHTVVGESGQPMTVIGKGAPLLGGTAQPSSGRAYAATLFEVAAIARLAGVADGGAKSYGVGAIIITHGESDSGSATYANDLFKLWSDYNQDLRDITKQTTSIPMLVSQQNAVPGGMGSTSASTVAQWHVGVEHPGDIVCIGPKYQYPYLPDSSGYIHLSARGYEELGEKFGQVYFERVVLGHDWQPLQPISAERNGNVITVRFHLPVPPLVWNDTYPAPHGAAFPQWANGRGFEIRAASAPATIDSVEIVGADTVKITSATDLAGLAVMVGYALTTDGPAMPGGGTHRWGHLRDSDPFVGTMTNVAQPNYTVAFQMATTP
jgi:hypothetical protein